MYSKVVRDAGFALLAKQKKITVAKAIEDASINAADICIKGIIEDAKERIIRQRVDEAKKYEPTDEEISAYIDMQIESKKKAKATPPPLKSDMQIDSEKVNKEK
jgi:hypothetical protein